MNGYKDVEIFPNGPVIISGEESIKNITNTLNDDLSEWVLVKVPIKHEFIDELTEMIKYEWRYRLYLSKVYEMLGYDSLIQNQYSGYYWEKDKTEILLIIIYHKEHKSLINFRLFSLLFFSVRNISKIYSLNLHLLL